MKQQLYKWVLSNIELCSVTWHSGVDFNTIIMLLFIYGLETINVID